MPDDEKIVWTAPAGGGILFDRTDWFSFPLGVAATGGAVFELVQAVQGAAVVHAGQGGGAAAILGWAALGAFGLWWITGSYVWDAYARSQTRYFVTDRAAYIVTNGIAPCAGRLSGAALAGARIERNGDGSGTIWFRNDPVRPYVAPQRRDIRKKARLRVKAFIEIADAEGAYAAVLAAQKYGN